MVKILLGAALVAVLVACGADDEPAGRDSGTVLVTGATGTQGGAVARELLERGYDVRALTRSPGKPAAETLRRLGAVVVQGNYDDHESLLTAMQDADGVFAVTDTWEHGAEREIAHGMQLIAAAKESGISHFVFTSVAGADANSGLEHFESKYEIEQQLAASGLDYSVVRPVEFMDNWRYSWSSIMEGRYVNPRNGSDRHQWIAASDIGFFVAEAFDHPEQWLNRTVEIAGDEMTIDELAELMSDVLQRPVEHVQIPWAGFRTASGEEMAAMYRWFAEAGYDVDIAALRAKHPQLTTVRDFLERLLAEESSSAATQ